MDARRPAIVVLAGGRATRMGGEKAFRAFGDATLIDAVLTRLAGQGAPVALNVNGDQVRFARFQLPVLADPLPGQPGPLAGVLAGLQWAALQLPEEGDIVTVPCDCPFIPLDLVARLCAARDAAGADLACAASAGRAHPLAALWPVRVAAALAQALDEGTRRVEAWTARFRLIEVPFTGVPDPFFNVNTPDDLRLAEALLRYPDRV